MSTGYGMYQQQTAKMHMTPQLRQALKILQCSTPELLVSIEQELHENPVLEADGFDWDAFAAHHKQSFKSVNKRLSGNEFDPINRLIWNDVSLEGHLTEQLHFMKHIPHPIQTIIKYMIGNLDSNGYLGLTVSEIAAELQANPEEVERALSILHAFEPSGVGARNLKECLLIQLKYVPDCPALVAKLVENHLEDIAYHRIHKLENALHAATRDILQAIDLIKKLNPRPGAAFQPNDVKYITPDVVIEKIGDQYVVFVQDTAAPRLSINGQYERMWREHRGEQGEAQKYIANKRSSALFFIKCIEQRRFTLNRVTQAIVEEQIEFFRKGVSHLKPMTLKQIAGKVDLHESTISRATAGKYAQTPWGIFELKYFFPAGLQRENSEDSASSEQVKAQIKELISRESVTSPYSDQKIATKLAGEGIRISRRTVTKYREELGIASSTKRKRK